MKMLLADSLSLLADGSNSVRKVRELILELAIRGKLVPQNLDDEPAGELLKRISKERAQLELKEKIKKRKPLSKKAGNGEPFPIPRGWEWLCLSDLTLTVLSGGTPSKSTPEYWGGDIPWASVKDLNVSRDLVSTQDFITAEGLAAGSKLARKGEVLICTRMGLGKIAIAAMDVAINQDLKALRLTCHLNIDYFLYFYRTLRVVGSGMTVAGIKQDELLGFLVPVPPLAEQHRIVAKVDELMALCDRLEAQQADSAAAHVHLVQALLDSLTQTVDSEDFAAKWKRLSEHFHSLFTTESSVDALEQVLLQLAVMGKLVPQQSNDAPAQDLVIRIQAEKRHYLRTLSARKQRELAVDMLPKSPYQVPGGWEWQCVDDVLHVTGGVTLGRKLDGRKLVSKPYLRVANVQRWNLDLDQVKQVEVPEEEVEKYLLRNGDLLITEGGDWDKVGRAAIWRDELSECLHQNHVFRARPFVADVESRWAEMYLNSPFARDYFAGSSKQTTNLASINMTQLRACAFPLPPIAEQQRIIAKFDQLMVLCEQLKSGLATAAILKERVAAAVVAKVIAEKSVATVSNVIHLSSYLVSRLGSAPTFGRTAHMKWLFLADQHLGLELGMTYERQAAGPLDKLIYQIEEQAAQSQLYAIQKETLKSGIEKIVYRPDVAIDRAADAGAAELGGKRAELDRLIGLLGAHKTEDLEIVATLYAVWNDALAEGQQPDDGWLINEFRTNWHKGKERFSPELLAKWLSWMREHRLVPVGKISSTRHQGNLLH